MEPSNPYVEHATDMAALLADPSVNQFEHTVNWPALQALLPPAHGINRILDFGCGAGNFTQELTEHYPRAQIVGADASLAMLPPSSDRVTYTVWNGNEADFDANPILKTLDGRTDLLIAKLVLHYLSPDDFNNFLACTRHLLSKSGCAIISVPHPEDAPVNLEPYHSAAYATQIGMTGFTSTMHARSREDWLSETGCWIGYGNHRSLIHEPEDSTGHKKRLNVGIYPRRTRAKLLKRLGTQATAVEASGIAIQL
jgi:predicted TPR repeat methyltransferase